MKLWLLRPRQDNKEPWKPWYDKAFGFVVRAESATEARILAASDAGDEGKEAWLNDGHSTCVELTAEGLEEVVIRDYASA